LSSRDLDWISGPCPKKGQNSAYHRLHVDPSSQSREPWETVPKSNNLNRTETLILHKSFDYGYYPSSSPKNLTLSISDIRISRHSYRFYFSLLGIFHRLFFGLSRERTPFQDFFRSGGYFAFPEGYSFGDSRIFRVSGIFWAWRRSRLWGIFPFLVLTQGAIRLVNTWGHPLGVNFKGGFPRVGRISR